MRERLAAHVEWRRPREDDDLGEPSLAVPEVPHWDSQSRIWGAACRSRLRDDELEVNFSFRCHEGHSQDVYVSAAACSPERDELETDIDTEEDDPLDTKECAYEDFGELDEADREGDDFPYDP
jgi:hypothetical protein